MQVRHEHYTLYDQVYTPPILGAAVAEGIENCMCKCWDQYERYLIHLV